MSNIIICDRCKVKLPIKNKSKFLFWDIRLSEEYFSLRDYKLHLCEKCFAEFKRWVGGK